MVHGGIMGWERGRVKGRSRSLATGLNNSGERDWDWGLHGEVRWSGARGGGGL